MINILLVKRLSKVHFGTPAPRHGYIIRKATNYEYVAGESEV